MRFQLAFLVCATTLAHSLPASLVASSSQLNDGKAAQALNVQFQSLTANSPCGNLTQACIDNSIATCQNDKWDTSNACLKSLSCFAIPDFRNGGTNLNCTSTKNALSLIEATGATGGITGADSTTSATGKTSRTATSVSPTATAGGSASHDRITVTVTRTLTEPTGFSATRTIAPQEASSVLSSLLADGQATVISQDPETEETPCTSKKHKKMRTVTSTPTPTSSLFTFTTSPAASTPSATAQAAVETAPASEDGYAGY